MKTRIVQIGNSQGIRIPKVILDQTQIGQEVELEVRKRNIIIRPLRKCREGWLEAFHKMAEQHDDILLDREFLSIQSSWDEEEWTW